MEPTSEQELKELLEDGKITEDEYRQLLDALHQKQHAQPQPPFQQPKPSKSPEKYGKAALMLMIAGLLLPVVPLILNVIFTVRANGASPRMVWIGVCPFMLFGIICLLLAFIFGIIGWKTPAGKIAAIGTPCLTLLALVVLPALLLFGARFSAVSTHSEVRTLELHQSYPLNSLENVITQAAVLDEQTSADGNGALRLQTQSPGKTVFRLFETGPMGIEDTLLFYSAKIKSRLQEGRAYLEMWCDIPGRGEFFSRGLENPVTGTTEWTNVQTPFRLETGQMPANIKLNLVIEGIGTVWIDDIKLLSKPL